MTSRVLLTGVLTLTAFVQLPGAQQGRGGPGGPGGMGPGVERKIVAQFDKDGDNRLNTAERKAAREFLASQPAMGPGMRGGRGGAAAGPVEPGPRLTPKDVKTYGNEPLYDMATLRTLFIQFEADDWEQEMTAFNNTDVDVPATLVVDGKTYKDVGVHFRGASSFFMVPAGRKHSLNLSVDFAHDTQRLGGYSTLNLLNSNGDPTYLRAVLYLEAARSYLPAPKANYARVVINGESWGVYINAQQFNKEFINDWYKTTDGARWKVPGSPGGRGGLRVPRPRSGAVQDPLPDQIERRREVVERAGQSHASLERDAAGGTSEGARADPRRGRRPEVPRARRRARERRRLLDSLE